MRREKKIPHVSVKTHLAFYVHTDTQCVYLYLCGQADITARAAFYSRRWNNTRSSRISRTCYDHVISIFSLHSPYVHFIWNTNSHFSFFSSLCIVGGLSMLRKTEWICWVVRNFKMHENVSGYWKINENFNIFWSNTFSSYLEIVFPVNLIFLILTHHSIFLGQQLLKKKKISYASRNFVISIHWQFI